ncbi:MAG: methionine--tRNA ligase [Gammaproteobacteria bacterium]|nr:methionine--tRNA ligase [Gammaproteobacteria bacterium]
MSRKILVTSALPYANGPLHLGHIIEAVQTDIWVRFQRMQGHDCLYVCAEDAHGTPIMIKAQSEGITPEELIARVAGEHRASYQGFLIGHDHFHSTHAAENRYFTDLMFSRLKEAGHITTRNVRQPFDEKAGIFLPDRYVRGTCPRCKAVDQYGDSCEVCGAIYTPADLIDPKSTVSGTKPLWRESEHIFFLLSRFEQMLREWVRSGPLQEPVYAKLDEWFAAGLQDWDISRDAPYFGFEIPGYPNKYFYVWFDAPIGYLGCLKALCECRGLDMHAYLTPDSKIELHHFIGKDISYFHTLFWPAVLHGSSIRRPTAIHVHGFLTIDGQKMSKSRGTFIIAKRYLELLPAEPLRYYFAAKLGPDVDDIDLSLEDFVARVNSDIVGKLVNIASRCAGFVARSGGKLSDTLPEPALYAEFSASGPRIAALYEQLDYAQAMREIMLLADRANKFIDTRKPWTLAKDPAKTIETLGVATQGINFFRVLMVYLAPVLPDMACHAAQFLGAPLSRFNEVDAPLLGSPLATYRPLWQRLDPNVVNKLIASTNTAAETTTATAGETHVTLDDFSKLDLRVANVKAAVAVDGSDKLLKLTLDLGGEIRTVFSGIRKSYTPESVVGRNVVMIANLAPRKMRFGVSEGMVLCASGADGRVYLLSADDGVAGGMKIS